MFRALSAFRLTLPVEIRVQARAVGRSLAASVGFAAVMAGSLVAQNKTKVSVDVAKPLTLLYSTSIGMGFEVSDGKALDPATTQLLRDAGVTLLRYPGSGAAGLYHWSAGTLSNPYTKDKAPYWPPQNGFPATASTLDGLGTALVAVNYGSNLDGSGGGEPTEAAAWVAYANGSPSSAQAIGKDSKGNDWKTVGYWASLRAAIVLANDDGLNALRIGHPRPLGIQLWTIGSEVWNNGFYGKAHVAEPDLHAGPVESAKDLGSHGSDARLGPTTYGAAVVQFAKAMKAVDSSIFIGASMVAPPTGDDNLGKNWNANVLKAACASMDFAAVSFVEGGATLSPDYKRMNENELLLSALATDYQALTHDLLDKYKKFCPAGKTPPLAVTNMGVQTWPKVDKPVAIGLFAADAMATLIEAGAYTVVWSPAHSVHFLDSDNNAPKPAYYGLRLLHLIAPKAGDSFVTATSQLPTLAVHAVKRADGGLGLLFINKDLQQSVTVKVSIAGFNVGTKGTRYDYGQESVKNNAGVAESPIDNLGSSFTIQIPLYSMSAVVIPKAQ